MQLAEVKRARMAIEIAPLVDLVFLLLVFFMVGARFVEPVIDLELAEAASGTQPDDTGLLVVLNAAGEVRLDGAIVAREGLGERLRPLLVENPERLVTLRADRRVAFADFVAVMDTVRLSGGAKLHIEHEVAR